MKHITSRDNPLYKEWKELASSSQARRKAKLTLLDGTHLAQAFLQSRAMPAVCIVSQSACVKPEIAAILAQCEAGGAACVLLADGLYRSLSQVEHGEGPLLVIETPEQPAPALLTEPTVLLDNLQDPGNLGSILRSAAAAGIQQVICSPGSVFAWSPKVLRAGMGAHFLLRIVERTELLPLIETTRIPVAATSSHARLSIFDAPLAQPIAWLFGHEGQGVSTELLQRASMQLTIPQPGGVESLNAAAAAAVCLFEQVRQLRNSV